MKLKQLLYSSIFAFQLTLCINNSDAQIVLTDIQDTTIFRSTSQGGTMSYIFDIDNNASNDYILGVRTQVVTPSGCPAINPPLQTNLIATVSPAPPGANFIGDSAGFAAHLIQGAIIDSAGYTWSNAVLNTLYKSDYTYPQCLWDSTLEGNFTHGDSSYIAVKFKSGATIHYGWIHIYIEVGSIAQFDNQISLTILDYAYNSIPNTPIMAGDTIFGTGLQNLTAEKIISVFPNPSNGKFIFNNNNKSSINYKLQVLNSSGEILFNKFSNLQSTEIDLETYGPGIYFYRIVGVESVVTNGKLIVY